MFQELKNGTDNQFPQLFKKSSTGAIQTWQIQVNGDQITVSHGQLGGAIQVATETIKTGKNQGRANATTKEQQALAEAEAKFTKQLKKGYCRSLSDAESGAVDETVIAGGINPMLAHKYRDHSAKIKFPCYGQPKLDGMRCIAIIEPTGKVTLWSRTRKPITSVPHIVKELSKLASVCEDNTPIVLDGELYVHKYKNDFEKIISLARQEEPAPGHEVIQYWVYDLASTVDFANRTICLSNILKPLDNQCIVTVQTYELNSQEELEEKFASFLEEGYEGLMARNVSGGYENKRSYNLQKVKEMQDLEYLITGVESGRGKREGQAVLVCKTADGQEFRASPKGNDAFRVRLLQDAANVIGKYATIQYQNLSAYGVPRFGVAKCVRDYE
jgi:ATP-dependent DNA ligase